MSGRVKRGFWNEDGLWIQYWATIEEYPYSTPEPETPDYTGELILALDALTAKQRFVIECRYGFRTDGIPMTVCEIASFMGITHVSVLRLEKRALASMRRGLQKSPIGAYAPLLEE
jgi:DNA-directed RNA polymerase specialized sigma24 family protein